MRKIQKNIYHEPSQTITNNNVFKDFRMNTQYSIRKVRVVRLVRGKKQRKMFNRNLIPSGGLGGTADNTKSHYPRRIIRRKTVSHHISEIRVGIAPGSAAPCPFSTCCRAFGIINIVRVIWGIPVPAPFGDIPAHVIDTKSVR